MSQAEWEPRRSVLYDLGKEAVRALSVFYLPPAEQGCKWYLALTCHSSRNPSLCLLSSAVPQR